MNNIIKSNNIRTAENDVWKVYFNKVNYDYIIIEGNKLLELKELQSSPTINRQPLLSKFAPISSLSHYTFL